MWISQIRLESTTPWKTGKRGNHVILWASLVATPHRVHQETRDMRHSYHYQLLELLALLPGLVRSVSKPCGGLSSDLERHHHGQQNANQALSWL